MNDEILFILNPISGVHKNLRRKIRSEIVKQLRKKKISGEIKYSKYSGHASVLAKEAVLDGYKYVVVSGGDGSINEVAKELINTDVALGIIPSGSGNGLAHSLGIPFDVKSALTMIQKKNTKIMDTLNVNRRVVVSIAGIGFDANVAHSYSLTSQRGFLAYFKSMISEYLSFKPEKIKILYENHNLEAEIFSIVFANSNQFGYKFKIAPHASCFDALMDVTTIKPFPIVAAPFSSVRVFLGHADKSVFIDSFQCNEITVIRENPGIVNIDGDCVEMGQEINVKVVEKSLKVMLR